MKFGVCGWGWNYLHRILNSFSIAMETRLCWICRLLITSQSGNYRQHVMEHILIIKRKIIFSLLHSGVLCMHHYLLDMLKESTTHESWQKYYVNFPANLDARIREAEEEGMAFVCVTTEFDLWEAFEWKTVCCRGAPSAPFKSFLQFVCALWCCCHIFSHNFSLMRSLTHVFPTSFWLIKFSFLFSFPFLFKQSLKFMCFKCGLKIQ